MDRKERLLARGWERARRRVLQTEGFLEDALAAALEVPEFWRRFVELVGLTDVLPAGQPRASTQDSVDEGRTDVTLGWPGGYQLALELKTTEPPAPRQIEGYLRSGLDVLAIAKLSARISVDSPRGRRFFGVVTWTRIRGLDWAGAPLEVRQMHRLLDAAEVVMPEITQSALEGIVASWDTWDALQAWSRKGLEAAQAVLDDGGFKCVMQEKARQRVRVDVTHQRLVWWMWPRPWQDDSLAVYAGLFMGRADDPVTHPGLPDLILALHVDPASERGARLRGDRRWTNAATRWASRSSDAVTREFRKAPHVWEILRCRASSREVLGVEDQGMQMIAWMEARAKEWVDEGIAARLAALV